MTQNLGKYLGVSLFHERVTNCSLSSEEVIELESEEIVYCWLGIYDEIERLVRKFIWGATRDNKKVSLVSWRALCQRKDCGRLGFPQLKDQSKSFMLKLGFNIFSIIDFLWVRVLRSKFGVKEGIPEDITYNKCSILWRSLFKIWPVLRENLFWSVGDGESVRCWKDNWILEIGPLCNHIPSHSNINLDCFLRELVIEYGRGIWICFKFGYQMRSSNAL
ncbi:LINE-1 reverse transcriptase isogeny [Gossypium australe]|uniref:LINE-1 reverse transcriptase isogeny n=1 Tax=Gossypium australe TaxID=47621 RepID=A0A5B6WSG8_9ROSI|nr:LINE-1 reverse transcriptase isogeny [Gossypium australe]